MVVGRAEGGDGGGDFGEDFGDGEAVLGGRGCLCQLMFPQVGAVDVEIGYSPLTYHTRAHHDTAGAHPVIDNIWQSLVRFQAHLLCIFNTTLSRHCICTTRIHNHRSNPLSLPRPQHFSCYRHRRRLELVLRKHRGGRAWRFRGYDGQVGETGIGGFDADMGGGGEEALRVCATGGDVLLFGGGDAAVAWGGVVAGEAEGCEGGLGAFAEWAEHRG